MDLPGSFPESPSRLNYFCHSCSAGYLSNAEQLICPTCGSDFVEQVENSPQEEFDQSALVFESLLGRFLNLQPNRMVVPPNIIIGSQSIQAHGRNELNDRIPPQLALLLQMLTRGVQVESIPMHGQSGDYIFGDRGLDNIITQLMEQYANQNMPPPAPKEAIDSLPKIKIQMQTLGDNTACPICQDDFKQDEEGVKLPCNHLFHPNCVVEWLKVNGTCPVCRYSLVEHIGSST